MPTPERIRAVIERHEQLRRRLLFVQNTSPEAHTELLIQTRELLPMGDLLRSRIDRFFERLPDLRIMDQALADEFGEITAEALKKIQ